MKVTFLISALFLSYFVNAQCLSDPMNDCDGDGVINGTEVMDGTDPLDPCDRFGLSITEAVTPDANGDLVVDSCNLSFGCQPGFYQVISGHLKVLDVMSNTYTNIGPTSGLVYNAMAYNPGDSMMYAIATTPGTDVLGDNVGVGDLLRVDRSGSIYFVASTGVGGNTNSGDIYADSILVCRTTGAGHLVYGVDLVSGATTLLGGGFNSADAAVIGDTLYGMRSGTLYRFDLISNTLSTVSLTNCGAGIPFGLFGAAYVASDNELYFAQNITGEVYQVTGYDSNAPCAVLAGQGDPTQNNDGASCPSALSPFTVGLPVELLHFGGVLKESKWVALTWTTLSEVNNSHFTIEKSSDLKSWEEVVSVSGSEQSNDRIDYKVRDLWEIEYPYYRLTQFDVDGSAKEHGTIYIKDSDDFEIALLQNPCSENVAFQIVSNRKEQMKITLTDMMGRTVAQENKIVEKGSNSVRVDVNAIETGQYYAIITMDSAQKMFRYPVQVVR